MFVAIQSVRTRSVRDDMGRLANFFSEFIDTEKDLSERLRASMRQSLAETADEVTGSDGSKTYRRQHLDVIIDAAQQMIPVFAMERRMQLVHFERHKLMISDHPVALYANAGDDAGIGSLTAEEVWLPLSRNTAVVLLPGGPHQDGFLPATGKIGTVGELPCRLLWSAVALPPSRG